MADREKPQGRVRPIVYCIVPRELASRLHDLLRRHFTDDASVEVIVEQRGCERRHGAERRSEPETDGGRRRVRAVTGRRVADRRAAAVAVDAPCALPRRARAYSDQLVFVELLQPSSELLEDRDTARLVTRIQAGERELFAELYLRYFDRVYSYLRVLLGDFHDAEDATQQVFFKVLEALPRYERRRQPFRAWLFRIARNQGLDNLGHSRRVEARDPTALIDDRAVETVELDVPGWITDRELVMFIERLPLAQRQVIAMRYLLDLSISEIASVLELEANHVSVLHHRGITFLRARLTAVGRAAERTERRGARAFVKPATVLRSRRFALMR